jgi:hypothetical protein
MMKSTGPGTICSCVRLIEFSIGRDSLCSVGQEVLVHTLPRNYPIAVDLREESLMWNGIKGLLHVQKVGVDYMSFIHDR